MTKQIINIGTTANDRTGDPLRTSFRKTNENFDELYTAIDNIEIPTDLSDLTDNANLLSGNNTIDIIGSVFADNSTLLVDGINAKIVGNIETANLRTSETAIALGSDAGKTSQGSNAVAVGSFAGETSQGDFAIAIGREAGETLQGQNAVAIGRRAGETSQGESAVAIGFRAGETQANNSIVINATGSVLNNIVENTFVVKPVRQVTGAVPTGFYPSYYNPTTGEFIVVVSE
jgi:hypothetical protein